MEDKYVKMSEEFIRRDFPSMPTEEVKRIVRESIEEVEKMEHVNLKSYDRINVINYLTKERQLREHDAKGLVSSRFAYYDSITKEMQSKALTEVEKSKILIAEIGCMDIFMKKAGLSKEVAMNTYRRL